MPIKPLREMMHSIDAMPMAKKTTFLFLIMVVGMLLIGSFAHMSLSRMKNNFDILYTKQMLPTIRLENLKDIYTVNILDTIRDIEKGTISHKEGETVIALAQELIGRELKEYKSSLAIDESDWTLKLLRSWGIIKADKVVLEQTNDNDFLIAKIEQKIYPINHILQKMFLFYDTKQHKRAIDIMQNELYPSVYSINIDLTSLIHLNLDGANKGYVKTQKVYDNTFEWIVILSLCTIALAAVLAMIVLQNIRLLHTRLANMVDEKTQELQHLNRDLELRVLHEVEQSRQKDQIMFRQSRLASMGEMIGNIAHQWRQPLNALVLIIQSFQMKRMAGMELSDEFIDKQVNEGMELASMMSHTIDDFRHFFKPNRTEELFSAKEAVLYSVKLIRDYYEKAGISIGLNLSEDVQVYGYPNEFSHVIMNLLSNAKDALMERGVAEKNIEITMTHQEDHVIISVIDNGGGLGDEVMDRMFEPYFTTKHKSAGTGIGLYMSQQIIEKQMKGSISGTNTAHRFQNGKHYDACAVFTLVIPLQKKEEK